MSNTPDKAAIAEANQREAEEAIRLASERKMQDMQAGVPTSPAQLQQKIADSIKNKLQSDDYKVFVDENGNPVPPGTDE